MTLPATVIVAVAEKAGRSFTAITRIPGSVPQATRPTAIKDKKRLIPLPLS